VERLVAAVRAEPAGGLSGIAPQGTPRPNRGRDLSSAAGLAAALCIVGTAAADEVLGHVGPVRLLGEGPNRLSIGAGVFDAFDESRYGLDGDRNLAANLDLRAGRKLFGFGPAVGATANVNGGVFGYAGLYADLAVADFVVMPLIGAGAYRRGTARTSAGPSPCGSSSASRTSSRTRPGWGSGGATCPTPTFTRRTRPRRSS
jgi:hypothetical protein